MGILIILDNNGSDDSGLKLGSYTVDTDRQIIWLPVDKSDENMSPMIRKATPMSLINVDWDVDVAHTRNSTTLQSTRLAEWTTLMFNCLSIGLSIETLTKY